MTLPTREKAGELKAAADNLVRLQREHREAVDRRDRRDTPTTRRLANEADTVLGIAQHEFAKLAHEYALLAGMLAGDDPHDALKAMCDELGQKAVAAKVGVSAQYVNDQLRKRRDMNAEMAERLGYRQVVLYVRMADEAEAGDAV